LENFAQWTDEGGKGEWLAWAVVRASNKQVKSWSCDWLAWGVVEKELAEAS